MPLPRTALKPQTGRCSVLQLMGALIHTYTDSVSAYISKCIDDVVPRVNVRTFPNQKPWENGEVCPCSEHSPLPIALGTWRP